MRHSFATAFGSAAGLFVTIVAFAWVLTLVGAAVDTGQPSERQPLPPANNSVLLVNR